MTSMASNLFIKPRYVMFCVLFAIVDRKFKVGLSSLSKKERTWTQSPTLFANDSSWEGKLSFFSGVRLDVLAIL